MAQNQLGQHTHTFAANVNVTGNSVVTAVNNNTNYHDSNIATSASDAGVTAAANVAITVTTGDIGVNVGGTVGNNNYNNVQEDILPPFTVIQYIICYQ